MILPFSSVWRFLMGFIGFHYAASRVQGYQMVPSVLSVLNERQITDVFIDCCAVFFSTFQQLVAKHVLDLHIAQRQKPGMDSQTFITMQSLLALTLETMTPSLTDIRRK